MAVGHGKLENTWKNTLSALEVFRLFQLAAFSTSLGRDERVLFRSGEARLRSHSPSKRSPVRDAQAAVRSVARRSCANALFQGVSMNIYSIYTP